MIEKDGKMVATTRCEDCTEKARKKRATAESKADRKAYNQSAAGKARQKRANTSEKGKARTAKFKKSAKGKEQMKRTNRSDAVKKSKKKHVKKLQADKPRWAFEVLQRQLGTMARVIRKESATALSVMGVNATTLKAHLQSTWPEDGSMDWSNYGYGSGKWNIGHRIAKAMYDASNEDDVKSCWSLSNLIAQDHDENRELHVKLPSDETLRSIEALWPVEWQGNLPSAEQRVAYETNARGYVKVPVP
tara:strand:+ start:623 stop:1363 length:741 start_codon:yes stop_codon:yes gene_type:complete